jgi:hypothetical protein
MNTLTAEELNFTRLVAKGLTATTAYRQAFPAKATKSYKYIRNLAYMLMAKEDIKREVQTVKETQARLTRLAEDRIEQILVEDSSTAKGNKVADVAMFMYEQANGKATQKIETKGAFVSVTYDLSGGDGQQIPKNILDQLSDVPPASTP